MKFNEVKESVESRTQTTNHEGGEAYAPESARLMLYKRAINNLLTDTFYEEASEQFERVNEATFECLDEDPEFVLKLAYWAREEAYLREVPQLLLVHAANHEDGKEYIREYAEGVMQRADEPLEVLAMQVEMYGKSIPRPLQKGIEDALHNFDTYQFAKYDSERLEYSYRDLLNLVHPTPRDDERDEIFERIAYGDLDDHPDVESLTQHRTWENERSSETTVETFTLSLDGEDHQNKGILQARHREYDGREETHDLAFANEEVGHVYPSIIVHKDSSESEITDTSYTVNEEAGEVEFTIEADLTEADEFRHRLDDMGLFAKIRNVRNMREAGLDGEEILGDDDLAKVEHTKIYPFRFYQAYKALEPDTGPFGDIKSGSEDLTTPYLDNWFEQAIDKSVQHVPETFGETYVTVDLSGSMDSALSEHSSITMKEIAALFGAICAAKGAAVSGFASKYREFSFHSGTPVLEMQKRILNATVGSSTNGHLPIEAITKESREYENVAVFTDMQLWNSGNSFYSSGTSFKNAWDRYSSEVSDDTGLYVVDLNSYGDLVVPEGYDSVYRVSGWTDNVIKHIQYASGEGEAIRDVEEIEP